MLDLVTLLDLETIILRTVPPFQRYPTAIEAEPVGKVHLGQYVRRTLSFLLVPLITAAIIGTQKASKYFPKLPIMFDELVCAIRIVLRSDITIYRDDVTVHPSNHTTLYFSSRLQDAVLEGLSAQFMPLYYQLQQWIQERFNKEMRDWYQRAGGNMLEATAPLPTRLPAPRTSNVPALQVLPAIPDLGAGGMRPSEIDPYAACLLLARPRHPCSNSSQT